MLALILAIGQAWTVDDDGPADFASIAAAIASPLVADGDALLVSPGEYGSFAVTKSLAITAAAGDLQGNGFHALHCTVRNVGRFTVAGMRCRTLELSGVNGRVVVDQCQVGEIAPTWAGAPYQGHLAINDCAQVIVSRSSLHGTDGCYPEISASGPAMSVAGSTVAIVDSLLEAGDAAGELCSEHYPDGSPALSIGPGSDVTITGSSLVGGAPAWGVGSSALEAVGSTVRVRGAAAQVLRAHSPKLAIGGDATASVSVSGVTLEPPALPPWVAVPAPPDPFLASIGGDAPGAAKSLVLRGPAGATALLGISLVPSLLTLSPGVEPVWLDPAALFPLVVLVTAGQEFPVALTLVLPPTPALAGLTATAQAWFPGAPIQDGDLTNPVAIVLRW